MFLQILFILAVISLFVYIIFLYILIKYRKKDCFDTSFFSLCIFMGIHDIVVLVITWICLKIPMLEWFALDRLLKKFPTAFAKVFSFFAPYCGIGQQIGMAAVAINRYSAICRPHDHDLLWTKKLLITVIVGLFVCPLPIGLYAASSPFIYPIDNNTGTIGAPYYQDQTVQLILGVMVMIIYLPNVILMLILYGLIMRKIRQHMNQVHVAGQNSEMNNTDKKLGLFGFSLFLLNFVFIVIGFGFGIASASPDNNPDVILFVTTLYMAFNDFMAYCNPWFMLIFSKNVREHFWAVIRCKEPI